MKVKRHFTFWPPRFRTQEDAELYQRCLQYGDKFPEEKWIHPCHVVDGMAVTREEYKSAPYEIAFFYENA